MKRPVIYTLVTAYGTAFFVTLSTACTAIDGNTIIGWMKACDSVATSTQAKCDDRNCHTALHRLIEEETTECYVQLNLGPPSALANYKPIDASCHREGSDPGVATGAQEATHPGETTPVPTSATPSPSATVTKSPAPTSASPVVVPKAAMPTPTTTARSSTDGSGGDTRSVPATATPNDKATSNSTSRLDVTSVDIDGSGSSNSNSSAIPRTTMHPTTPPSNSAKLSSASIALIAFAVAILVCTF